ncbi:MAG: hypothetical protein KKA79_04625 [Nanoarchaeota archaeon]|nr:hypothetical protein [Nanoarchaeota archaeon]
MKYFLIYNPTSRQGKSKADFERIKSILTKEKVEFEYAVTSKKDEAISLARKAPKKFDVIVAIGGDGTICEVITGILSRKKPYPKLGVVHIGTSPDFNRYHKIPIKLDESVKSLIRGRTKKIDIGKITHLNLDKKKTISYFGSSVNIGLGPNIASKSNGRYREYLGDFLGTLLSTLVSLTQYKKSDFKLNIDDVKKEVSNLINLTIGKDPFIASGMRVPLDMSEFTTGLLTSGNSEHAQEPLNRQDATKVMPPVYSPAVLDIKQDDGKMYCLSISGKTKLSLLVNLWRLYLGNILNSSGARLEFCRKVIVEYNKANPKIEFDGDYRGYLPAKIEVIPRALEVITD